MVKAIGLLSGGLDSMLAVRVIQDQGIEVLGLTFETPFFTANNAKRAAKDLGIKLKVLDVTEEHLEIVRFPAHGYGRTLNPCIDCHAFMFRKAGELMDQLNFDFIFSGEVLGERPMSQNYRSLKTVAKESGYREYILRPLSAKRLPETKPESEGKVDRERLFSFHGRSRRPQIELAKKYNLHWYPNPAGGCLLTDPNFGLRLKDLMEKDPNFEIRDVKLLNVGRHLRLNEKTKLIIGRDENENEKLSELKNNNDLVFIDAIYPGPICLYVRGTDYQEHGSDLKEIAGLCASYSDGPKDKTHTIKITGSNIEQRIEVMPRPRKDCLELSIIKS